MQEFCLTTKLRFYFCFYLTSEKKTTKKPEAFSLQKEPYPQGWNRRRITSNLMTESFPWAVEDRYLRLVVYLVKRIFVLEFLLFPASDHHVAESVSVSLWLEKWKNSIGEIGFW